MSLNSSLENPVAYGGGVVNASRRNRKIKLAAGTRMQDRETNDIFEIVDANCVWVSYRGPSGEGSVRADMLREEFKVLDDQLRNANAKIDRGMGAKRSRCSGTPGT